MKHKQHLIQTGPDYHAVYLPGSREQAHYLELRKNYTKESLEADVQNGGGIFRPLGRYLKDHWEHLPTRYALVCSDEEAGLCAVQILAQVICSSKTKTAKTILLHFKAKAPAQDPELPFQESEDRIAVVDWPDLYSFSVYSDGRNGPIDEDMKFWWLGYGREMICVRRHVSGDSVGVFGNVEEDIAGEFARFSSNAMVFYLVIDDRDTKETNEDSDRPPYLAQQDSEQIRKLEKTIFLFSMTYAGGVITLPVDEKNRKTWYRAVFDASVAEQGLSIDQEFDPDTVLNLLMRVNRQDKAMLIRAAVGYIVRSRRQDGPLRKDDFAILRSVGMLHSSETAGKKEEMDALEQMSEEMVCQDRARQQVEDVAAFMEYERIRRKLGFRSGKTHNVLLFVGPSGTGKSSAARYLAKALAQRGLVEDASFLTISGSRLKGEYVGQTAHKIHEIFKTYSTIFIDEAYSLISHDSLDGADVYAKEALAQLAVEIEENSDKKCVIFAGYGEGPHTRAKDNLMFSFVNENPGIASRLEEIVYFGSYTPEEMTKVFHRLAKNSLWQVDSSCDDKIRDYFEERSHSPSFGNGREARTLLEYAERQAAVRLCRLPKKKLTKTALTILTPEDVRGAIAELSQSYRI